ncbi:hypothetical protein [Methylobacterium sp. E-066]|jgi:hypothetical protein|uniref:hypothetical protein n=1 Tax=Methylobacterium sp. E-066 TaxID=2836584 RepID=UPI001FB909EE|nr:hypothetical protein [Methylobacterium sp. E-066]MCJ2139080.1 hypothetical protein [Methylobacterium sp. E-066]
MSLTMSVALALTAAGGSVSLTTDSGASIADQFAGSNVAFMAGIGAVILGGLGVLLVTILS